MKTAAVLSTLALALPAFAAPAGTSASATPIATPQDPCQESYNKCLAAGTPEVACSCTLTACLGEDNARNREYCSSATASLASATATSAPAATSSAASSAPTGAFGGVAIHSGSDIQYAAVNAAGSQLWLNKDSATYCPSSVVESCSNTTTTQFRGGSDQLSLDTVVPGGQQVYVAADGTVGFTIAHSASIPDGASRTGFSIVDDGLHLQFQNNDFIACPKDDAYEVFAAALKTDASDDCLGFSFRIAESSAPAAWQYT